jgi:hypothetical protein
MQARPLWLMSDPLANPQFRRHWLDPPWPKRKRPAPVPTDNRPLTKTITTAANHNHHLAATEARRAAEALFVTRPR